MASVRRVCNNSSMATTVLVRAKLTKRDWQRFRKLAIDRDVPVSDLAGDAIRALLKGASRDRD